MPEYRTEPLISPANSGLLPEGERNRRVALTSFHPTTRSKSIPQKTITCYECGKQSEVPAAALSANCIHCHAHLNMADIELKPGSRRLTIRTLGDVTVPTDTVLSHATIICRNLTMHGRVSGSFRISGTMALYNSLSIESQVKAEKLIIGKGSQITLSRGAELGSAEIYGRLTGDLQVRDRVTVHSGGSLTGDCRAVERLLEPGASHEGIFTRAPHGL